MRVTQDSLSSWPPAKQTAHLLTLSAQSVSGKIGLRALLTYWILQQRGQNIARFQLCDAVTNSNESVIILQQRQFHLNRKQHPCTQKQNPRQKPAPRPQMCGAV